MGPVSKAAVVRRQLADSEFQAAVLEEFAWLRETLNRKTGGLALDKDDIAERFQKVEERVSKLERPGAGPSRQDA